MGRYFFELCAETNRIAICSRSMQRLFLIPPGVAVVASISRFLSSGTSIPRILSTRPKHPPSIGCSTSQEAPTPSSSVVLHRQHHRRAESAGAFSITSITNPRHHAAQSPSLASSAVGHLVPASLQHRTSPSRPLAPAQPQGQVKPSRQPIWELALGLACLTSVTGDEPWGRLLAFRPFCLSFAPMAASSLHCASEKQKLPVSGLRPGIEDVARDLQALQNGPVSMEGWARPRSHSSGRFLCLVVV